MMVALKQVMNYLPYLGSNAWPKRDCLGLVKSLTNSLTVLI